MKANTTIQIRLTKQQKERIRAGMQNMGYKCMSTYLRSMALEYDLASQQLIREMHKVIVKRNYE